jgi:4-diphosphocytidyl-2-C-methyl-D-erythritol kinase
MTPIEPPLPSGTKVCLVKPNVGLSTPAVFKALDYAKLSNENPETLLEEFITKGVIEASCYINDLETPAFTCVPLLASLKAELQQQEGFQHVLMSGSGTTIFCIGEPTNKQEFMKNFGSRSDLQVFFSAFINRKEGEWFERPTN